MSVPLTARRIVSLAPSITASLVALNLQDRLVGVTDFCVLPPRGPAVSRVGGILNPSLETIRSLRPDLVIATTSGNDPSLQSQVATLGLPLYTIHTPDVEATLRSLVEIAGLLGDRGRGESLTLDLRRRLNDVQARTGSLPHPRVLYLVWGDPLVVPGRQAFLTDALRRAGAASVTADAPAAWPAFDLESVMALAPDVILTSARNRALAEGLPRDPAWSREPAVRLGRVFVVSDAIEQPGPEVVGAIEELARILHPEAFRGAPAHGQQASPSPGPSRGRPASAGVQKN